MGNSAKRDARELELSERRSQAVKLRIAGISYDAIAKKLGYLDRSHASRDIKKAIHDTIPNEERELLRKIENARLNTLFSAVYPKALSGDYKAHTICQGYDRAIRELNGLDTPIVHEFVGGQDINISIGATPAEARRLIMEKFAQDESVSTDDASAIAGAPPSLPTKA